MKIQLTVNGRAVSRDVTPEQLLVQWLREDLALTGTHVGCDTAQCGACTVHLNGRAVKACSMLAVQADGASITTIEGLAANDGTLHPMQAAFKECHGLQCGFCTPGMVMSAVDLVQHHDCSSEAAIREGLEKVEAGAQGEHKVQRGYLPEVTFSAHWIADPRFRAAIARFVEQERDAITAGVNAFEGSPFGTTEP